MGWAVTGGLPRGCWHAMEACGNCGRTRRQGTAFCTGCGRRFADDDPQPARAGSPFATSESAHPGDYPGPAESYGRPAAGYGSGSYQPTETHRSMGPYGSADPYRRDESGPPAGSNGPAVTGYPPGPPGPSRRARPSGTRVSRLTFRPLVTATVVILFAAAIAVGAAVLYVRHHGHTQAAQNSPQSTRTTPSAQGASPAGQGTSASGPGGTAPAQSPSDTSSVGSTGGAVTVGSGASQNPDASSVAAFLDQYFNAINAHDYQSYLSLLSPQLQQGMTSAQFEKGYRSTADSNETLVGISTASTGDLAAKVTFTSHQDPADSPDQSESCTDWNITLFLAQSGSGYVIDPAPPGYRASYQPC
jgi:hypothetical protein